MKKQIRKPFLFFVFLLVTIFLLNFSSCDTTEPPPPTKSPRDYTWSVDTLGLPNTFQTLMLSIWGSSENDVYSCGHISGNRVGLGDLWHYDGKQWETIDYSKNLEFRGSLQAVHGTSDDNVWIVGYKYWQDVHSNEIKIPYIIKYDGARWEKHEVDTEHGVYGVYVVNEFETWACGDGGIVYHYKNHRWDLDTIKVPMTENDFFIIYSVVQFNGEVYAIGTNREKYSADTQYYFFKKESGFWKKMDEIRVVVSSTRNDITFGNKLIVNRENQLLSYGSYGIYIWKNNSWEKYFPTNYIITSVFPQSNNNLLAVGDFGIKYHYNGSDWQELNEIDVSDIVYSGVWANNKETFIVGFKGIGNVQKSLVLHGK